MNVEHSAMLKGLQEGYDKAISAGEVTGPEGYEVGRSTIRDIVHDLVHPGGEVTSDGYYLLPDESGMLYHFMGSLEGLQGDPGIARLNRVWWFLSAEVKQAVAKRFEGLGIAELLSV